MYVVLELMAGGELFERIAMDGPLPEAAGRRMSQQLLDGLAYCHAQGVYHRCGPAAPPPPTSCPPAATGPIRRSDSAAAA